MDVEVEEEFLFELLIAAKNSVGFVLIVKQCIGCCNIFGVINKHDKILLLPETSVVIHKMLNQHI